MSQRNFSPETNELALNIPEVSRFSGTEIAITASIAAVCAARIISPNIKNVLPEPVDVPDHIGNLGPTFGYASVFAQGFWKNKGREMYAEPERQSNRDKKAFAAILGVVVVGVNVAAEKIGFGSISTPDYLDFAYGCAGGYLAYRFSVPKTISAEDVSEIYKHSRNGDGAAADNIDHAAGKWLEKKTEHAAPSNQHVDSTRNTKLVSDDVRAQKATKDRHDKHRATKKARKNNRKRK